MATMMKEKRRDKKKSKEKYTSTERELPRIGSESNISIKGQATSSNSNTLSNLPSLANQSDAVTINRESITQPLSEKLNVQDDTATSECLSNSQNIVEQVSDSLSLSSNINNQKHLQNLFKNVVAISTEESNTSKVDEENELTKSTTPNIRPSLEEDCSSVVAMVGSPTSQESEIFYTEEHITPSAPIFHDEQVFSDLDLRVQYEEQREEIKPKVSCFTMDELLMFCHGEEMEEVRVLSDREEALVEAGPVSGPDHPLVDLLSTFRSSLIALEGERMKISGGFAKEKEERTNLWQIHTRVWSITQKCHCGVDIDVKVSYNHAELKREKLPAAKLRLEALLRDLQDSYCHHQHSALLAHWQIEELISETIQGDKAEIREALSLVFQALRFTDNAPGALASALQRWAAVLSAAAVHGGDLAQLIFLFHHLFKQTRSVFWASHVVNLSLESVGWARSIAILDLLLSRLKQDVALPCTEDMEEVWEELDRHESGAVGDGRLRERDLLALLNALPLSGIAGRPLLPTIDPKDACEDQWVDVVGGLKVGKACQCTRLLLACLQRGTHAHPNYGRLRDKLRDVAAHALQALALLHIHSRHGYDADKLEMLTAELEACFVGGVVLFNGRDLHKLPASLLSDHAANDYCTTLMTHLHENIPKNVVSLSLELPAMSCDSRVRIVTQAAIDRSDHHELANAVMKFLLQTIIKRKMAAKQCESACVDTARECVSRLLCAHSYLCAIALHLLAEINQTDPVDASEVKIVQVHKWRPDCSDMQALLDDWSRRCPNLLQQLLLDLDYTPYVGLALDVQIFIGAWLWNFVRTLKSPTSTSEWAWTVLRKLRLHRTSWHTSPGDAPVATTEPDDAFSTAYSLLYSIYGHCIPVICSEGLSLLCTLATTRPREAVHCLANIMLVLAHSPESVALTPKFSELFNILLSSGPSLVQRAFGRGGASGPELLQRLILAHLAEERCGEMPRSALLTVWLHSLWRAAMPAAAYALAEASALAARDWPHLDAFATRLLQEENATEHIDTAIRNASTAPLLCECILRAWHATRESNLQWYTRLIQTLYGQRATNQKIHVDNALQQISAGFGSEELCIYRSATAALSAPLVHPAHLMLWRLFMHLYLQPPPHNSSDPPVGTLFFSGMKKSRTLSQIKRRIQDTIHYHITEMGTIQIPTNATEKKTTKAISSPPMTCDSLLPTLSIVDLTGESQESKETSEPSDPKASVKKKNVENREQTRVNDAIDMKNLKLYHDSAVKLLKKYFQWLEEGEKVRTPQHYADIARFIPERALEAAWKQSLFRERPTPSPDLDEFPLPQFTTGPDPPRPKTPFQQAVDYILKIEGRLRHRSLRRTLHSLEEEVKFTDSRSLLSLVDKHLVDIGMLAEEWYSDVTRLSELDQRLWDLVVRLMVPRQLPPLKRQCPKKCSVITIVVPHQQWCLSADVELAIEQNRQGARSATRGLAKPRMRVARAAAALHTIARRLRSSEAAVRVVERAWRHAAARGFTRCAQAQALLTDLVGHLAERWICHDGKLVTDLLSRWCKHTNGPLQQSLCGALVSPRRLPHAAVPSLYTILLDAKLPSHTAFSYLSKFDLPRWSTSADSSQRRNMLEALTTAVCRYGSEPAAEHRMLVELFGVHTCALMDGRELCGHVVRTARAAAAGSLPAQYWALVPRAADGCAASVPTDQLGNLLRELAVIWWEVRTKLKAPESTRHAKYAPHIARLLHSLQRGLVASAVRLSYETAMVAWYAWSGLQEAWGPWISPHPTALPLLPSTGENEEYTPMVRHFVDNVHQIMLDCPGSEVSLLQNVFEWCIQMYLSAQNPSSNQESRVQASSLLVELTKLPWTEHQWFYGKCLPVAMQVSKSTDKELTTWCCSVISNSTAETMVRDGETERDRGQPLANKLATLLYLFTGTHLQHSRKALAEATRLPWCRLPEPALAEALETFFRVHHSITQPYHELPQFRVMLFASELCLHQESPVRPSPTSRAKRCGAVSHWVRAAVAPNLAKHVTGYSICLLNTLAELAPLLEGSEGEIEELFSRAVVIMCMEPAATDALPVWVEWVSRTGPRSVRACASAAGAVTVLPHFASLADAAARAHLLSSECNGWAEICKRWSLCPWREPRALLARGALHAAYAVSLQHAHNTRDTKTTLPALLTTNIHFVNEEAIIAVWICYACRIARECAGPSPEERECRAAAAALLARWAEPPRRSILKVVTLSADTDRPTPRHRLLCRFALYILSPSEATAQAYETACGSTLGSNTDLASWAKVPHPRKLPRLAIRLFPQHEWYFKLELDFSPPETN